LQRGRANGKLAKNLGEVMSKPRLLALFLAWASLFVIPPALAQERAPDRKSVV